MGDLVIKAAASNSLKIQSDNATNVLTVGTDDSVTLGTEFKVTSTSQTFTVKGIDSAITDSQTGTDPNVADSDSGQLAIYNGATKLWGITEHGYVVNPNVPSFRVRGSATVTVTATGYHKIQWNTDSGNNCYNDGNFDTTNSRYTAPISGKYWFATNLRVDGAGNYFRWLIVKNGSTSSNLGYTAGLHGIIGQYISTNYQSLGISGSYDLSAGDFVCVYLYSYSDTSWSYLPQESNFSGFLIG